MPAAKIKDQPSEPVLRRVRRTVASPTSGALAYTCFCLVTLLFAVCLVKMPLIALERVAELRQLLS